MLVDLAATPVTLFLLAVNVLVSLYALYGDPSLVDRLAFKPRAILKEGAYYRLLSGGFVHASLGHLFFNMFTLYFFGPYMEAVLGSLPFLGLYLGAELAAHGLTLARHRDDPHYAAVGASGAVSGVIFGFCLFQPLAPLYLFLIPIGIPAVLFAVVYVVGSIYAMRGADRRVGGGIAHEAHLGGALGGVLLTILIEPSAPLVFLSKLGVL